MTRHPFINAAFSLRIQMYYWTLNLSSRWCLHSHFLFSSHTGDPAPLHQRCIRSPHSCVQLDPEHFVPAAALTIIFYFYHTLVTPHPFINAAFSLCIHLYNWTLNASFLLLSSLSFSLLRPFSVTDHQSGVSSALPSLDCVKNSIKCSRTCY